MAQLTPMMRQYMDIKEQNKDAILMYRLGDFYEMFFEDAKTAAKELDLVLTGRDCGLEERAPMCGVPHHAVDSYIGQLVGKGYKVAICEQLEDPKSVKGIVKRGITRVVTAGTLVEPQMLEETENNYILALISAKSGYGISWCDVSTGEFKYRDGVRVEHLSSELLRLQPRELLIPEDLLHHMPEDLKTALLFVPAAVKTSAGDWMVRPDNAQKALFEHFHVSSLSSFDATQMSEGLCAAGALLDFLHDSQKNDLAHITRLEPVRKNAFMTLDSACVRNLELVQNIASGKKKGSLLWFLDRTKTAGGARLLKKMLLSPLLHQPQIEGRLDAVEILFKDPVALLDLRTSLDEVRDLERILSRLSYGTLTAKDALALKQTLSVLPKLKETMAAAGKDVFAFIDGMIEDMGDLKELLEAALAEDPPAALTDGGLIKKGYSAELDELIDLSEKGTDKLIELETREKQETGIRNLKVRYNRVFGYFIEVSKGSVGSVPDRYMRKQTLANGERYITEELKELEESILSASERRNQLEYSIFGSIRDRLKENIARIQKAAQGISNLDVIQSMSQVAYENNFVRPQITDDGIIEIKNGRHPVVEKMSKDAFVPNDAYLDRRGNRMLLITGPNMAGKSTFMRQIGLIVLLAHIGSFVPADAARICLVDRIFTRVGASDDLASGQSTFMVEMNELANILHNATPRSLLILDEIGRGTSTGDGLSIARASAEYILDHLEAKTLFATHFHELIDLAEERSGVVNCSVAVKEMGSDIVFLHRIVPGGTDKSFGIEVAKLAGLPAEVIDRAKKLLRSFSGNRNPGTSVHEEAEQGMAIPEVLTDVLHVNPDTLAPLEALNLIYRLQKELKDTI